MVGEKYANLKVLIKAALSISHGQADVEHGFFVDKLLVTENRVPLKKKTIIALRTIKDIINTYDNINSIPILQKLLQEFHTAHAAFEIDLAAKKEEKSKDIV